MQLGVCYYPEQWPQERWREDARLMNQAGISLVRIAEFAWALMEPSEGLYSWDWLDLAIETLAGEGLGVILGTPTASPPPWLCRLYPDILPVDAEGRKRRYGSRRHYCPSSHSYQEHTVRIVRAMATRYGSHPAVTGWQIDNEFGCHNSARCYCESCAGAFRRWLEAKYGTLTALNQAWGNIFWGQIYAKWDEIQPPNLTVSEPNPSHVLDYYRFASDALVAYLELQHSTLKSILPESQFITNNFMSQFTDLDYFDLAERLDMVTMSSYPTGHAESSPSPYMPGSIREEFAYDVGDPFITGFGHTLMRGFKQGHPFWVMEQQCGNVNWSAYNTGIRPGTVRLWTWHALANGAEAVLYFRWRAGLFAQEQLHSGLLRHDASPGVGFADLEMMSDERAVMSEIASTPFMAEVALLLDYDSLWAIQLQPHHRDFNYVHGLFTYYRALQRLGLAVDIVSGDADLSQYKVLIAPTAFMVTEHLVRSLTAFVEAGGTLLLGVRSGFKTADNRVVDTPLPGLFRDLAGITVEDWHSLPPGVSYELSSSIPGLDGSAKMWAEVLKPAVSTSQSAWSKVDILAQYTSGPFRPEAALIERKVNAGRILYLGWYPNEKQAEALVIHLATQAGISNLGEVPEGLVAFHRGSHIILLNFTDQPRSIRIEDQKVVVGPRDVRVLKSKGTLSFMRNT